MTIKMHTSKKTAEIFETMGQQLGLQPFILAKLSIALSVRKGSLEVWDFESDNEGLELNRTTIFGEHDLLFKTLIVNNENRQVCEDEYFPVLVKAHMDRGAKLLQEEKRYSKDFYNHMCNLDSNI